MLSRRVMKEYSKAIPLWQRIGLNLAAFIIIFSASTIWYWDIDNQPPYEYLWGEIIPPFPPQSSQINSHWRVKVNRKCPGWVERDIIDAQGWIWRNKGGPVDNIYPRSDGTADVINQVDLPRLLRPGPVQYIAHVHFYCNPWQQIANRPIMVTTPMIRFQITEEGGLK